MSLREQKAYLPLKGNQPNGEWLSQKQDFCCIEIRVLEIVVCLKELASTVWYVWSLFLDMFSVLAGMNGDKENDEDPLDVFTNIDKEPKRLSIEKIYQKKSQLEHILLRPDTYIGSVEHTDKAVCTTIFLMDMCLYRGDTFNFSRCGFMTQKQNE